MEEISDKVIWLKINPGLTREHIWENFDLVEGTRWEEIEQDINYRRGDLGIIQPAITKFYSEHNSPWKKSGYDENFGLEVTCILPKIIDLSKEHPISAKPEWKFTPEDKLVLVYHFSEHSPKENCYRIVPLNEEEFTKIRMPKNFEELVRNYSELDRSALNKLRTQYEQIKMFNVLVQDTIDIGEIPLELTARKINPKNLREKQKRV